MKTKIAIIATLLLIATTAWASMVLRSGVLRSAVIGEEPVLVCTMATDTNGDYAVDTNGDYACVY